MHLRTLTHETSFLAYAVFARFGWCNPLVLSAQARRSVASPASELHRLLLRRMAGTDHGSRVIMRALRRAGVSFEDAR